MIDPDYLDHNLNRVEPNGNIIKMGVELDAQDKFPVAYWFLHRRPNDYFYNYAFFTAQRYYRVPADEIIHLYRCNEDSEQTRGWPWIFAGLINLWRANKAEEAALVNMQIGASKGLFYSKEYPEGFDGNGSDLDDDGYLIDRVAPGTAVELPYGVKPLSVDMRYPDAEYAPFRKAICLGMALTFGTSYATTTGDLSEANFVSSKLGVEAENALYHDTQELIIEGWKIPGFDEELYRGMLAKKINLPIAKFDKFNSPIFTGHRRSGIQPLEEAKANESNLNNRLDSPQAIVERGGGDWEELKAQIAKNEEELNELNIPRIVARGMEVSPDDPDAAKDNDANPADPANPAAPAKPAKPAPAKK
jgi:lambda family phage portal protein